MRRLKELITQAAHKNPGEGSTEWAIFAVLIVAGLVAVIRTVWK